MRIYCLALAGNLCLASGILAQQKGANQVSAVVEILNKYAAAVQSKDMSEIVKHVVASDAFSMFEGGHVNWGWVDYRDNHLSPELKEFKEILYAFRDIRAQVSGDMAYATFTYYIAVKMESRDVESNGLATAILVKTAVGWKIQHMHTSRIPPRRPEGM